MATMSGVSSTIRIVGLSVIAACAQAQYFSYFSLKIGTRQSDKKVGTTLCCLGIFRSRPRDRVRGGKENNPGPLWKAVVRLCPDQISTFCRILKRRLTDSSAARGKVHLRPMIDGIRLEGNQTPSEAAAVSWPTYSACKKKWDWARCPAPYLL